MDGGQVAGSSITYVVLVVYFVVVLGFGAFLCPVERGCGYFACEGCETGTAASELLK